MDNMPMSLEVNFDSNLVKTYEDTQRNLLVEVRTKESSLVSDTNKAPLNLALVLDVSTTMRGSRMKNAKAAACGLVSSLTSKDSLSIVSFGKDVQTHMVGESMNNAGKNNAIEIIESLEHRKYTNLTGGWLEGANCVATVMEGKEHQHTHIVLLSDGHANVGILDSSIIIEHAEQLRKRGVYTSTVGIGDNYSSVQLQNLAEHGGGRMHDAEHPVEIVGVVGGELNELRNSYLDDIVLSIESPNSVFIQNVGGFPESNENSSKQIYLGSVQRKADKKLLLRVKTNPEKPNQKLLFNCTISARIHGSERRISLKKQVSLTYTTAKDIETDSKHLNIASTIADVWQASVARQAAQFNRYGNFTLLQSYLESEFLALTEYLRDLPEKKHLLDELQILMDNSKDDWDERIRKEIELQGYRTITNSMDYRPNKRDHWSTTFQS